jgi:hypothetical protein
LAEIDAQLKPKLDKAWDNLLANIPTAIGELREENLLISKQ